MLFEHKNPFSCHDAQRLMAFMPDNDSDLSLEERESFEQHLRVCPSCAAEYEEDKQLTVLLKQYWAIKQAREAHSISDEPYRPMTIEESWEDLKRRCPSLAEACRRDERKRKLHRVTWRIGSLAAAACLLVAIGIGWVTMRDNNSSQFTRSIEACSGDSPTAFAELVTDQSRKPLEFNQPVTTSNQPQEIFLGGMHRMVMNSDTTVMFSAKGADTDSDHRTRYEIQLAKGEIYVEVVPGHPFKVRTNNAQLNITGTKFDVVASPDETTLTLLKGSVQFGNLNDRNQSVAVTAGYGSSIRRQSTPSQPMQVDALAVTAWARDFVTRNTLAHARPGLDEDFLESVRNGWMRTEPPDLDKLDYEQWRDEHREWFKQQFPWIFKIQEFLKEEHGIETDYIDLLMISGDIWQFNYPRPWNKPIPIRASTTVKCLSKYYNVSLEQFEIPTEHGELPLTNPCEIYQNSLTNWQAAIANANQSELSDELLLFNLTAGQYLTNTRTAAYLWTRQNPQKVKSIFADKYYQSLFLPKEVTDKIRSVDTCQDYLKEQLFLVAEISHNSRGLFITPKSSGCQENTATAARQLQKRLSEFIHGGLEK